MGETNILHGVYKPTYNWGPHLFGYCMLLHKIPRSGGLAIDLRKMEPEHMKSKNHSVLLAIETSQLFPAVKITLFFGGS